MHDFSAKPSKKEDKNDIRNEFQRDRDRILYSKSFRRLSGKTQVFFVGAEDHIRTRLTHTLEVNQIASTISGYFKLNSTLTEAIALGHDIGHTPFGHVGERVLNEIMNGKDEKILDIIKLKCIKDTDKGFKHNLQALRILKDLSSNYKLENSYGLDISKKTLWGIANHSSITSKDNLSLGFYNRYLKNVDDQNRTFEALIVRDADEIAQRHHDIEDAIELKLIPGEPLLKEINKIFGNSLDNKPMYKKIIKRVEKEKNNKDLLIANYSKLIVDLYVSEYINYSSIYLLRKHKKYFKRYQAYNTYTKIGFSAAFKEKDRIFQNFLKSIILNSQYVQVTDGKGKYIIKKLFQAYLTNPQQMPDKTISTFLRNICNLFNNKFNNKYKKGIITSSIRREIENNHKKILNNKESEKRETVFKEFLTKEITAYQYKVALMRTIVDYITGMTDKYALKQYEILYGTAY